LAQITLQDERWLISGAMTMSNVNALLVEAEALTMPKKFEIDLKDVSDVDTATIALIFEWLRNAHAQKCKVVFSNFPANLISLATLYGVIELIPQTAH